MGIALYIFDPASTNPANIVRPWGFIRSDVAEPYGFCMGRVNGEVHALLVAKDGRGRQYRIDGSSGPPTGMEVRSEEHTSELQSLMRISYAVFCLKKKKQQSLNH